MRSLSLSLLLIFFFSSVQAFAPQSSIACRSLTVCAKAPLLSRAATVLFASDNESSSSSSSSSTKPSEIGTDEVMGGLEKDILDPVPVELQEGTSDVIIDVPSPILLSSSIVLGIISTGAQELFYENFHQVLILYKICLGAFSHLYVFLPSFIYCIMHLILYIFLRTIDTLGVYC